MDFYRMSFQWMLMKNYVFRFQKYLRGAISVDTSYKLISMKKWHVQFSEF